MNRDQNKQRPSSGRSPQDEKKNYNKDSDNQKQARSFNRPYSKDNASGDDKNAAKPYPKKSFNPNFNKPQGSRFGSSAPRDPNRKWDAPKPGYREDRSEDSPYRKKNPRFDGDGNSSGSKYNKEEGFQYKKTYRKDDGKPAWNANKEGQEKKPYRTDNKFGGARKEGENRSADRPYNKDREGFKPRGDFNKEGDSRRPARPWDKEVRSQGAGKPYAKQDGFRKPGPGQDGENRRPYKEGGSDREVGGYAKHTRTARGAFGRKAEFGGSENRSRFSSSPDRFDKGKIGDSPAEGDKNIRSGRFAREEGGSRERTGFKSERPSRTEHPGRNERSERGERPERSERPGRNERPERTGRPERAERFDRNAPRKKKEEPVQEPPTYDFKKLKEIEKKVSPAPKPEGPMEIRLNRFISNAGVCSRRDADTLIAEGRIKVNGNVVTEMGHKVTSRDVITLDNKPLKREKLVYVLLNKPKDHITTTDDPDERKTVMDLVKTACQERIYPVGRLDRNTTGLLLLTNDGELAEKLAHPANHIKKLYQVELDKPITEEDFLKIKEGVELEDGKANVDHLELVSLDGLTLGLEIHIGKNRIVRRIFEHLGYEVVKLDRVMYAGLTKKDLPRGTWRYLTERELIQLKFRK
jgi:23S rRNA pseudouridine2605 synthase